MPCDGIRRECIYLSDSAVLRHFGAASNRGPLHTVTTAISIWIPQGDKHANPVKDDNADFRSFKTWANRCRCVLYRVGAWPCRAHHPADLGSSESDCDRSAG